MCQFIIHRYRRIAAVVLGLLLLLGALPGQALTQESRWLAPLPQGNDLHAVIYGADRASPDGIAWTQQRMTVPPEGVLTTARYGPAVVTEQQWVVLRQYYVCSTKHYTDAECLRSDIYTSADGFAWTLRRAGTRSLALAHTDGRFLAVGARGHGYASQDGARWERVDSGHGARSGGSHGS